MGFAISWLGVKTEDLDSLVSDMGLTQTDERDEASESPFSVARLPTGWSIVFINDYSWPSPTRLQNLSMNRDLICVQIEEHVMASDALFFRQGQQLWSVEYRGENGPKIEALKTSGAVPAEFDGVQQAMITDQALPENHDVDLIWDIPVTLAERITGFRHDRWRYDWGEPEFYVALDRNKPPSKLSWLDRLMGRKG